MLRKNILSKLSNIWKSLTIEDFSSEGFVERIPSTTFKSVLYTPIFVSLNNVAYEHKFNTRLYQDGVSILRKNSSKEWFISFEKIDYFNEKKGTFELKYPDGKIISISFGESCITSAIATAYQECCKTRQAL